MGNCIAIRVEIEAFQLSNVKNNKPGVFFIENYAWKHIKPLWRLSFSIE
jgi:hypothetical protein